MLLTNIIASAVLVASGLAAPLSTEVARNLQMSPREYWAFAFKTRDSSLSTTKREASAEDKLSVREYWAFAFKVRDGSVKKRAKLESQCEQAEEGIYCTYTSADIEAYGTGTKLDAGCITVDTGVSCFYPGATPADA